MLRLRQIKPMNFSNLTESEENGVAVTFAGDAGEFAHCEITLRMVERETDADLLSRSQTVLREAIETLHAELEQHPQHPPSEGT